ncbi:toprim domain-containing protein, partial [Hydrogenophaga flava]|uniref:toprim domain-containing protein n=1 Tax=Hydrogenophaga flava TaxID=65657 RepID=UPI0008268306
MYAAMTEAEIIDQFRRAMAEHDIRTDDALIADGKFHRMHVVGDRKLSRNGWYVLHLDGLPSGAFGCNKRYGNEAKFTWSGKGIKPLTTEERLAFCRRMEAQRAARDAEKLRLQEAAAQHAQFMWDQAQPLDGDDHPYLKRKGVRSHGLRVGPWEKIDHDTGSVDVVAERALLIPIRDTGKALRSMQAIFPAKIWGDRDKDYLKDGVKDGCFFAMGKPVTVEHVGRQRMVIMIGEGYATVASAHEATGHAGIVAFDAGNLVPVAKALHKKFPDALFVLLADNDQWTGPTHENPHVPKNPGLTKAHKAAEAVGGLVVTPPFARSEGKPGSTGKLSGPTDFNDLHQLFSLNVVRDVIEAALEDGARPARVVVVPTEFEAEGVAYAHECLVRLSKTVAGLGGAPLIENDTIVLAADDSLEHVAAIARCAYPEAVINIMAAPSQDAEVQRVAAMYGASAEMPSSADDWRGWGEHFLDMMFDYIDAVAGEDPSTRELVGQTMARAKNGQLAGAVECDSTVSVRTGDHGDAGLARNNYFTILGHNRGTYYLFLHNTGQVSDITKSDMSDAGLIELAPLNWWETNFPHRRNLGIDKQAAAEFLIRTAERRGIYDPNKVRGRGAWVDDGRVVFHHGAYLTVDSTRLDVTQISSRYVYERAHSLPEPHETGLSAAEGAELLELLQQFRWGMPGSALLFGGWLALATVCGALPWRPHIWITGSAGPGKTTLANIANRLLFETAVYAQGNSSEPGIRQALGGDARPVLMDESESKEEYDVQRIQKLLSLIRQASSESGAITFLGTSDGKGMRFNIRSMFCLASIQVATKNKADIDRLAVLTLRGEVKNKKDGDATWSQLRERIYSFVIRDKTISKRLLRRSIDLLPITLKNIEVFTDVAAQRFGTQRAGDQYGT